MGNVLIGWWRRNSDRATTESTPALPGSDSFRRYIYTLDSILKHISKMQKCLFPYFREILRPRCAVATSGHSSFTLQSTPALPGSDSVRRCIYISHSISKHISKMQKCLFPYFREMPTERVSVTWPRQHSLTCCERCAYCVESSSETFP